MKKSNDADGKDVETITREVGGKILGEACSRAADAAIPGSGPVLRAASEYVPDRVKTGAAAGALIGGAAAGKVMAVGSAYAIGLGVSMFVPAILVGSAVVGLGAWILGDD